MTCPPPDQIQAAMAGTLPPHLQQRVQAHVEQCPVCQTLGAALEDESITSPTRDERERIDRRVRTGIARDRRSALERRLWRWSAAAVVVATAGVGALMLWRTDRNVPVRLPEPRQDGQSALRPSVFRIAKEDLLSLAPSGQPRFAPADRAELSDLTAALAPYATGDFREALKRLRALVDLRPTSGPAHFYLAVTRMYAGPDDFRAVMSLEFAQRAARARTTDFLDSASWYLAMVYVRVGQLDRGRPMLKALCENPGDVAGRACAGLQELSEPVRIYGTITGPNGEPLSGVTVGQHILRSDDPYLVTEPTSLATMSDPSGRYSVVGLPFSLGRPAIIRATKPGYFTRTAGVELARDSLADFRLLPWTSLVLGAVVRGTVTAGDTPCGHPNERCDEFALTLPASGTIDVWVEAPNRGAMDLYVEAPAGEVYGPLEGEPMRLTLPARAGSTIQIRVLSFSAQPQPYELTTRLR